MIIRSLILALILTMVYFCDAFANQAPDEQNSMLKLKSVTANSVYLEWKNGNGDITALLFDKNKMPMPDKNYDNIDNKNHASNANNKCLYTKDSHFKIDNLEPGTEYYFVVLALNQDGTEGVANTSIGSNSTKALTLPAPPSNIQIDLSGILPSLRWNKSKSATTYVLDIASDSEFKNLIDGWSQVDCGDINDLQIDSLPLDANSLYIRLQAWNSTGPSIYSETYVYKK